jgi:hypothetical protein
VAAVAAGGFHNLALKQDRMLWSWGFNSSGQLGDGTTTSQLTPVRVNGLTDVLAIAAGREHSLAVVLANTPTGPNNVVVQPVDTTTGTTPVTVTFTGGVNQPGVTMLSTSSNGPPPPATFKLGNPATYYELTTTAGFTPPASVCVKYAGITFTNPSPPPATLPPTLFHFENNGWAPLTTTFLDTTNQIICANTSSFSPFALFMPLTPQELMNSIARQIAGFLASGGIRNAGIANSLMASLDNARKAFATSNPSARGILGALLSKLNAFVSGGQITPTVRDTLTSQVGALLAAAP